MTSSFSSSKLIFLLFLARIGIIAAIEFCGTSGNFTNNSTYQRNLQSIFSSISSNTKIDYGFYNFSAGQNSDRANVVALCREDLTPAACRSCMNDSSHQLTQNCPYNKEAIGWYGEDFGCMLRYSNSSSIFRTTSNQPAFYLRNNKNATNLPEFVAKLGNLMADLSSRAAAGDGRKKYAAGEVSLTESENIYGHVQCTPDLTERQCASCLSETINEVPNCCGGKVGARIIGPVCNIRYETYPFYASNDSAPSPSPSPSSPPPVSPPLPSMPSPVSPLSPSLPAPVSPTSPSKPAPVSPPPTSATGCKSYTTTRIIIIIVVYVLFIVCI